MAPARVWEEYLFTEHTALAVTPWKGKRGVQLLDVLVKRDAGLQWPRRPPVVHKIGNFFSLREVGTDDGDLEDDAVKSLQEALDKFTTQDADDELFDDEEDQSIIKRENLCNLRQIVKASSKTLASTQPQFASLHLDSVKEVTFKVEGVTLLSVDREPLQEAIVEENWKPNMKTIAKHGAAPSNLNGLLDLWLITDILRAERFTVEANTTRSAGTGAQVPGSLLGAVVGAPIASMGFNVESGRSRDSVSELTGGTNIPFGIRVMRLRYKADGTLYRIDEDGGGTQPTVRAGSPNLKLVDPVSDPSYNMCALFLNNVPINPEDGSCIPLEIVLQDVADSAQQAD